MNVLKEAETENRSKRAEDRNHGGERRHYSGNVILFTAIIEVVLVRLSKHISRKLMEDGVRGLLESVSVFLRKNIYEKHIRPHQPIVRYAIWNGVKMSPKRAAVRMFDGYLPESYRGKEYAESEGGEVELHKKYTPSGGIVCIIGGGRGVTAVHAAWRVNPDGRVIVYEGSEDMVEIIRDTVRLNRVEDVCDIRHGLVGPELKVYSDGSTGAEQHHPKDLPSCDVLEMDCEGAELDILREMTIRPDVMIIEVHPRRHPLGPEAYIQTLQSAIGGLGYIIVDRRSNEGEPLSEDAFEAICYSSLDEEPGAPVIAAIRQTSTA